MQAKIAAIAAGYEHSTQWAKQAKKWRAMPGDDKCNLFVADVVNQAGGHVPCRYDLFHMVRVYSPIGAQEWANPNSPHIKKCGHWTLVNSPQPGDIVAVVKHVGIVVGPGRTASAKEFKVEIDDFGFHGATVYWRYTKK